MTGETAMHAPEVIELTGVPDLTRLLVGGVVPSLPGVGGGSTATGEAAALPDAIVSLRDTPIDADHVAEYADVCGFRLGNTVPVTYPHMLGFPLSVMLMTRDDFPFSLLGMVHIRNRITQHRPVPLSDRLDLTARVADLRPHAKGQQLDNLVTASVDGEPVWSSISTYLKRGSGQEGAEEDRGAVDDVDLAAMPLTSRWEVPGDIGRSYGAVSGDRNPIHLSALSAKAFGFPRAIAHGMWSKARCLAALEGRLPAAMTIDVAFKLPVLLPAKVEYVTQARRDGGWSFGLRSRDGKPHLAGVVSPL